MAMTERDTMAEGTGRVSRVLALLVSLAVCFAAAAAGGILTATSVGGWYQALAKPPFNPPDWIFAPVWNLLFVLMAIAAWRIWCQVPAGIVRRTALALFGGQLVANVLWSGLFFGLREPGWALAEIVVLEALILITLTAFRRLDRPAGLLLVPYAAWVGFALALNASIWWLN